MLAYIKGIVTFISPLLESDIAQLWLDVHGVGYKVLVARLTAKDIRARDAITLYLSESSSPYGGETTLYGFLTVEELDFFHLLRDLPGVGAKKALEYFDKVKAKSIERFLEIVIRGDARMLASFFGFSPKTAAKIVAELKEQSQNLLTNRRSPQTISRETSVLNDGQTKENESWIDGKTWEQAKSALVALGFDARDAEGALHGAVAKSGDSTSKKDERSLETLVRLALRELSVAK